MSVSAKTLRSGIAPEQRHTRAHPCQICGGWDNMRRGQGKRCAGYRSADGMYDYCERAEYAGGLPFNHNTTPPTAAHRLEGPCKCGATHGYSAAAPARPAKSAPRSARSAPQTAARSQPTASAAGSAAAPAKSAPRGDRGERGEHSTDRSEERLAATYDYYSADAVLVARKLRYEYPGELTAKGKPRKRFAWRQPDGRGGWLYHRRGVAPVLYRLPELLAAGATDPARPVYLAEGEKCADAVRGLGLLATTGPDGAPKWDPAYTETLRGRAVIILPDHDAAGWAQLALVAEQLAGAAASVRVLALEQLTQTEPADGIAEGADVADWIAERLAAGASAEDLRATLEGAASAAPLYADYAASHPASQTAATAANAPVARSQGAERPARAQQAQSRGRYTADATEGAEGADWDSAEPEQGEEEGAEAQTPTRRGWRVLRPGSADAGPSALDVIDSGAALELGQGSRLYRIDTETAPELAGLWVRGRDSARCLLSMSVQVIAVAASASREGVRSSSYYTLEVTTRDGAQRLALYADPETFRDGSVWASLAGLAVSYPQSASDCDKTRDAIAALAALEGAPRVALVPALGWQLDSQSGAPVWVRVDGIVTADGLTRHPAAPLRADVPQDWPQRLPDPGEEQRTPDARPLLELLRNFWPGSDADTIDSASGALVSRGTCYPAAALGTLARVRLPGWGAQPGRLEWQLEVYRRSGGGKTAFTNLLLALQGSGYHYNTATQLTQQEEGLAKDTAIGATVARSRLPYHAYLDMDYNAHPGTPDWDAQQARRRALLSSDGNLTSGGLTGTRSGGMRQRPRPAGALIRTGEVAPHPYSVARGEEGADARACTFTLPDTLAFDREVSERIERERGALVALGLAYDRWILRQGEELQRRAAAALEQIRAEVREQAQRLGSGWHARTVSQLEDMGLGLALFTAFLREEQPAGQAADRIQGAEELAAWLERQRVRLIAERLTHAQRLAAEYIAHRGGIGSNEQLAQWICDTLRGTLKRGKAHVTDPRGRCIAPQRTASGEDWQPPALLSHLPEGLSPADLGYSERVADTGEWVARGVRLGTSDAPRRAFLFWSRDVYGLLEEAARQQRRPLPAAAQCWHALEQSGALVTGADSAGTRRGAIAAWDPIRQRAIRALYVPWVALFPEVADAEGDPGNGPSGEPTPEPQPAPDLAPDPAQPLEPDLEEWGPQEWTAEEPSPSEEPGEEPGEERPAAAASAGQDAAATAAAGAELLAGLPDPYPDMWDWRRAAAAHSANGCQPARVWVAGKGSAGNGSGWRDLAGRDLFATLARQAQLGNPEPLREYAYNYVRWLAGRSATAPEPPTAPTAATPAAAEQPERTPERTPDKADKPERPAVPAVWVPSVWVPSVWVREPQRANRLGVVCGGWLFVWGTPDPQTSGGVAPLPAQSVNLYTPDSAGRTPAEDLAALAELQHAHKLRAVWLLPLEGERPGSADAPIVRDWQRLAQPAALEQRAPAYEWRGIAARALGNSPALAGLTHQPRGEEGRAEGEGKPEGKPGAIRRIHAPWVQDAWGLAGTLAGLGAAPAERARLFASGLLLAERALKMQWQYSPSLTGLFLLRETLQPWASRGVDLSPLPEEWQERLAEVRASDVRWARPVSAAELEQTLEQTQGQTQGQPAPAGSAELARLWVYDRNSSYVSSARAVPSGVPLEVTEYRPDMPQGVYLCDAAAPDGWDPRTPGPIRAGATGEAGAYPLEVRGAWVWGAYLKLALAQGWRVNVQRGYAWPREQVHETLRTWQGRVWDARRICEGYKAHGGAAGAAGAVAVRLIKRLGVATIGRLIPRDGRTLMDTAEADAQGLPIEWEELDTSGQFTGLAEVRVGLGRRDLVHPEWWSPIIAHAGARLLTATYTHAPQHTAGLYIDSLYTLRPCPALEGDPLKAGGYRLKANITLPAGLLARGDFSELVNAAAAAERELGREQTQPDPRPQSGEEAR